MDGDTFKTKYLMDHFQIQVNKTSINSVLFMLTIGSTRRYITLPYLPHTSNSK